MAPALQLTDTRRKFRRRLLLQSEPVLSARVRLLANGDTNKNDLERRTDANRRSLL